MEDIPKEHEKRRGVGGGEKREGKKGTFHLKTGALQEGQNPASDPCSILPLSFECNGLGWTEFSFQRCHQNSNAHLGCI